MRTLVHRGQYLNILNMTRICCIYEGEKLAGVCGAIFLTTAAWEAFPTTGPLLNTADCVIPCQREKPRQCTSHAKRRISLPQLHLDCLVHGVGSVVSTYLAFSGPEIRGTSSRPAPAPPPAGPTTCQIMLTDGEPSLALLPTRFRKLIWVKRGDYLITSTSAGDFETSAGETGKVRHRVEHILNKDQIKHLKKRELWPADDAFGGALLAAGAGSSGPRDGWGGAVADGGGSSDSGGGKEMGAAAIEETGNCGGEVAAAAATAKKEAGSGVKVGGDGAGEVPSGAGRGEQEGDEDEEEEEEEEDDMSDLFVNNNRAAMMQLRVDHEDDEEDSDSDSDEE
ncbi:unnamed protein product [Ectocarpus sp. 4 AP-2014]